MKLRSNISLEQAQGAMWPERALVSHVLLGVHSLIYSIIPVTNLNPLAFLTAFSMKQMMPLRMVTVYDAAPPDACRPQKVWVVLAASR